MNTEYAVTMLFGKERAIPLNYSIGIDSSNPGRFGFTHSKEAIQYLISADSALSQIPNLVVLDLNKDLEQGKYFLHFYGLLSSKLRNACLLYILADRLNVETNKLLLGNKNISGYLSREQLLQLLAQLSAD